MPSRVDPRSGPFPVYAAASPPAVDVGTFTIAKTGVDLKAGATVAIFTVPAGRTYVLHSSGIQVTSVTSGGAGSQIWQCKENTGTRAMEPSNFIGSHTPVANQTCYVSVPTTLALSNCTAADIVNCVISTSHAGSSAVSGTVYLVGHYVS